MLFFSGSFVGCSNFGLLNPTDHSDSAIKQQDELVTAIYKVLKGTKDSYNTSMESIAYLYNMGLISDKDKDNVIKAGHVFIGLYKTAVNALITYEKTRTVESSQILSIAISDMSRSFSELMAMIKPLI